MANRAAEPLSPLAECSVVAVADGRVVAQEQLLVMAEDVVGRKVVIAPAALRMHRSSQAAEPQLQLVEIGLVDAQDEYAGAQERLSATVVVWQVHRAVNGPVVLGM